MTVSPGQQRARQALRLADTDPARSVRIAEGIARDARAAGDLASAAIALRAVGLAKLHLEDPDASLRRLREAVKLGHRSGSEVVEAEARMSLAFVLNVRGKPGAALREIDSALTALNGVEWARAHSQRGSILLQLGRLEEAQEGYQTALPILRGAEDHLWVQRTLLNRAVARGRRHQFARAEADLVEAGNICVQHDLGFRLAFVLQNHGWIKAVQGDALPALRLLGEAEQRLREQKAQVAWLLMDRTELLLSLRLTAEARESAQAAVTAFEQERRWIGRPEARLLLAQALTLDGDPDQALRQAGLAVREFTRQQRPGWAVLARFTAFQARMRRDGLTTRTRLGQVEELAQELGAAGWQAAAAEAGIVAGKLALAHGRSERGERRLLEVSGRRRRGAAQLRALGWHAEALLRLSAGNRRGAASAARAGVRILAEHGSTLGATDLRAHAAAHRVELAEFGLRIALEEGRARQVLEWAEQGRAGQLMSRPVRPSSDPELAAMLAELRQVMVEVRDTEGRATPARLLHRQVVLERRIRDYCRTHPARTGPGRSPGLDVAGLEAGLGETALVEFVCLDDCLHAITLAAGRLRLTPLGPVAALRDSMAFLPFVLQRLVSPRTLEPSRAAARSLLTDITTRMDRTLFAPLAAILGDRPLVLVPTGLLQAVPWSLLPTCAGRPVTVCPSAALWQSGHDSPRRPGDGRVVVVAGPDRSGTDLLGAHEEARDVAALYGVPPLLGARASVREVMSELDGAALAHLAAHGRVHSSNPLFSSVLLSDGPLTAYDLETLPGAPELVVLAACDVGRSAVLAGDEILGLCATLLAQGTRQIIVPVISIPDIETAPVMVAFHRALSSGLTAAQALAEAQTSVSGSPAAQVSAMSFVSLGADGVLKRPHGVSQIGQESAGSPVTV
ncbi:CHAT domain-containing protein [Nonomuraea sp. NPDC050404]|uniref:CHAT domain-containing protein n=1 Tax=Nonomuraea sp. NPDC050404 TaxID=3155783 RepID=UPI0033DF4D33